MLVLFYKSNWEYRLLHVCSEAYFRRVIFDCVMANISARNIAVERRLAPLGLAFQLLKKVNFFGNFMLARVIEI